MDKLTFKSRFALILTILIAPFAGVSAAGLIDQSGGTAVNAAAAANAALDTTVNGGAAVNTNANINTNAATDASLGNSGNTSNTSNANDNQGGANSQGAAHADVNAMENASAHSSLVRITRDDAESADATVQTMTASNVSSDADLKNFAAASIRNDANLSSIGFANDRVEVAYREPARFLGFIPVSVDVDVVAHNDGTVDVSYPWYSFLMMTHRSDIEAAVKNEIGASATSTASWNASARASLVAKIASILNAHLSGAATTTAAY